MMSLTDLILDDTGDIAIAEHDDGAIDIVVWTGAETIMQTIMVRLRIPKGRIWYNRQAGIDYKFLFFSGSYRKFTSKYLPIARSVYREAVLAVEGVLGFETEVINGVAREKDITFELNERLRTVQPVIPCVLIDCENCISRGIINKESLPAVTE